MALSFPKPRQRDTASGQLAPPIEVKELHRTSCRWVARLALSVVVATLMAGCASTPQGNTPAAVGSKTGTGAGSSMREPDLGVKASVALRAGSSATDQRLAGTLEEAFLRQFPQGRWMSGEQRVDLLIELSVHDTRQQDQPFQKQNKRCRRYTSPGSNAKTVLQKLLATQCVDWQVETERCRSRTYELDLQVRGRTPEGRLVVSDRRLLQGERSECSEVASSAAGLRTEVEEQVGPWVMSLLAPHLRTLRAGLDAGIVPDGVPTRPANGETASARQPPVVPSAAMGDFAAERRKADRESMIAPRAHALVIGNNAYPGSAALANPVRDARAIGARLEALGFQVTRVENADRPALVKAMSRFKSSAAEADLTVLFYAGHGVQVDGTNYLLPIDVSPSDPNALRLQALPIEDLIEAYLPGRTRVVFLDACRDNPFAPQGTRGGKRGLAPMKVPEGTLIAFAAKDGGTAEDGTGQPHSPFTSALLEHLDDRDDIVIVLRKVRDKVLRATGGRQQPWDYGSLTGGSLVLSTVATSR